MGREVDMLGYFNDSQPSVVSGQGWTIPFVLGITDTQGFAVSLCET